MEAKKSSTEKRSMPKGLTVPSFDLSISTPYPNQGLYPHHAMTGVQLVRGWSSLWLWKKRWLLWCEEQ